MSWRTAFLLALAPLAACEAQTLPANQAAAATVPALTGRVVDRADILSPAQEKALSEKSATLEAQTGHQFVIVTLPSLDGKPIERVSLNLGKSWGIGRKGHDDGILLVVAPTERKVRIEVGFGLIGKMPDDTAKRIIEDVILPEFREKRLAEGIELGAVSIIARLSEPKA